jgi:glycosyltransferase involved in cell wall biosynthesis
LPASLIQKGKERSKNFSWEKCAKQTSALVDDLLAGKISN